MNQSIYVFAIIVFSLVVYFYFSIRKMKRMPSSPDNDKIIHLNEKNFNQTTKNGISLIDFWADWCMPCKMMTPVLNELADMTSEKVKICKVNIDVESRLASKFSVRSIPTLILVKNGKEIERYVGIKNSDFLMNQISKYSNN